jgi:hypothetical protein
MDKLTFSEFLSRLHTKYKEQAEEAHRLHGSETYPSPNQNHALQFWLSMDVIADFEREWSKRQNENGKEVLEWYKAEYENKQED